MPSAELAKRAVKVNNAIIEINVPYRAWDAV